MNDPLWLRKLRSTSSLFLRLLSLVYISVISKKPFRFRVWSFVPGLKHLSHLLNLSTKAYCVGFSPFDNLELRKTLIFPSRRSKRISVLHESSTCAFLSLWPLLQWYWAWFACSKSAPRWWWASILVRILSKLSWFVQAASTSFWTKDRVERLPPRLAIRLMVVCLVIWRNNWYVAHFLAHWVSTNFLVSFSLFSVSTSPLLTPHCWICLP